jgi:hypothetical protein
MFEISDVVPEGASEEFLSALDGQRGSEPDFYTR